MKKPLTRNVRLQRRGEQREPGGPPRRLEQILLSNRHINWILSRSARVVLTALLWPRFVAPYRWQLTRHPFRLANLHPAFEGYKILHLTDLHAGYTRLNYLTSVIDKCLLEKPGLVLITGDLIDYWPRALPQIEIILRHLTARHPNVVAIFGNHDYHEFSWRHIGPRSAHRTIHKRLVRIVQSAGVRLLRNEHVRISPHNLAPGSNPSPANESPEPTPPESTSHRDLVIVGLDEMWTTRADPHAAFEGLSPADPILCLQHNPDGIDFLKPFPWQVMLCGHSHGGQAIFPIAGPLYVPMEHREYLSGFFPFPLLPGQPPELRQRLMFVSRGLGHSTPIRWCCPPEATLFTLTCAKAASSASL